MKGVILAGGMGTRLMPLTRVTNKHLLPVYDRPMIHFPIGTLLDAGIDEILIVTGGEHAGDFLRLLGNGRHLGIRDLHYTYQEGHGGIADALSLARDFADDDRICVVLGDNIFGSSLATAVHSFERSERGAQVLLKRVADPRRFGVPRFDASGAIAEIIEKPADPPSHFAVVGVYMYAPDVFDICEGLEPSGRGELEITDVNNQYLRRGELAHHVYQGWWSDAGTFASLLDSARFIAEHERAATAQRRGAATVAS